jgi:holo-ACP synthase/triphosphoribosyl-dephospho-CoA synthase
MTNPILDARELRWNKRHRLAKKLLEDCKSQPDHVKGAIVSFSLRMPATLRTAGKYDPIALELFHSISTMLCERGVRIMSEEYSVNADGPEGYIAVSGAPIEIKRITMEFENRHPSGELVDVDVMGSDGICVGRNDLGIEPRRCYVCGGEAIFCSAGHIHLPTDVEAGIEKILSDISDPARYIPGKIGRLATTAMLYEAAAHPKPGLVTPLSAGAHRDMDYFLFQKSAAALAPWFIKFAEMGFSHTGEPSELFPALREAGKLAERDMLEATGGVNTHKGLIFSLGAISAAAGIVVRKFSESPAKISDASVDVISRVSVSCASFLGSTDETDGILSASIHIATTASNIVRDYIEKDFDAIKRKDPGSFTVGEKLFLACGIRGIRGEAELGFPSVVHCALPRLRDGLTKGLSMNDAMIDTLLVLCTRVEDSNVLGRSGKKGLRLLREEANRALEHGGIATKKGRNTIASMDSLLSARGISPGGCADLLAVAVFLFKIGFLHTESDRADFKSSSL